MNVKTALTKKEQDILLRLKVDSYIMWVDTSPQETATLNRLVRKGFARTDGYGATLTWRPNEEKKDI